MPGIDDAAWRQWRHALVRDLAWVLASPPLLAPAGTGAVWLDNAWGQRAFEASHDWLARLDRHPDLLESALSRRPGRLGSYFESLLDAWLAWPENPLYSRLFHGVPVRVGKQTVGEFDFIVEDRATGEIQHWEVAVKFYLGIAPGGQPSNWVGPGLKDRLDLKLTRLVDHQLPLGHLPEARPLLEALAVPVPRPVCLVKGRLFYPANVCPADWAPTSAANGHLKGWWMNSADFLHCFPDPSFHWMLLPREHWLAPVDLTQGSNGVRIGDPGTAEALIEAWQASADNRAAAVVGLVDGQEVTRGFITPSTWPRTPDPA
ncbi:MAG TPA: DUF1853 family protein [Moraxellaceae bacterium]|nr:DUF1853 family protein [Moraxellaceae bacterium]